MKSRTRARQSAKRFLAGTLISSLMACASGSAKPRATPPAPPAPVAASGPHVTRVSLEAVGLDSGALDRGVDPCRDFYQFACGGWIERTDIPADKPRWMRSFNEIHQRNETDLREILETSAKASVEAPTGDKFGDFYAGCMDEAAVEKAGLSGVMPLLSQARRLGDRKALAKLVTELHQRGIWALFDFSAEQDFKDATRYIAHLDQNGLGLPDRDYYTKDDEGSQKLRERYAAHVERMLKLSGMKPADAKRGADDVMRIETELAKVSKTKVERRDPKKLYNKIDRAGVEKTAPRFGWSQYFAGLGRPEVIDINVTSVRFFEGVDALLGQIEMRAWRSYFQWHILRAAAPALPKAFVDESFELERLLTGQQEQRARWKRCVEATDKSLGELLAQPFVSLRFAGESKGAAEVMVREISAAFTRGLINLGWMDETTRQLAREKLAKMAYLIGYPSKWKSYEFEVDRAAHTQNFLAGRANEVVRHVERLGRPVDREEWEMTPPTVNAYYHPLKNQMVFPAGILQPPFYSVNASIAVNMGAMGMVVGHELTHGFDDEGSQFDAVGNLRDWWDAPVRRRFEAQTGCIERQYSSYEALPGLKVNGKLTLGENIADVGGVKIAFYAYRALRAAPGTVSIADGFDEDQQFFLALAQVWCAKYRDEYARMAVQVDPHAPPRFRVNGSVANVPEFGKAFGCSPGSAMMPQKSCTVW